MNLYETIPGGLRKRCLIAIPVQAQNEGIEGQRIFSEIKTDFPDQGKRLKKWDRAISADLDQDGYPDLILNDHGYG
ncbi:MAG: hypothetical protein AAFV07_17395, partial [Bacteroidota bacterium]